MTSICLLYLRRNESITFNLGNLYESSHLGLWWWNQGFSWSSLAFWWCMSSGGSVNNMMEQCDAARWWDSMEQSCCCHNTNILCCYCAGLHMESWMLTHLNVKGLSVKEKVRGIHFPYLPKMLLSSSSAKWDSSFFLWVIITGWCPHISRISLN